MVRKSGARKKKQASQKAAAKARKYAKYKADVIQTALRYHSNGECDSLPLCLTLAHNRSCSSNRPRERLRRRRKWWPSRRVRP